MKKTSVWSWFLALFTLAFAANAQPPRSTPVEWSNFQRQASESVYVEGKHLRLAFTRPLSAVSEQGAAGKPPRIEPPASGGAAPPPPRPPSLSSKTATLVLPLDSRGRAVHAPAVSKDLMVQLYAPLPEGRVRVSHDRSGNALWIRDADQVLGFPLKVEGKSDTLELDTAAAGLHAASLLDDWSPPVRATLNASKHTVDFYGADGALIETFKLNKQNSIPLTGPRITRGIRTYELARIVRHESPVARPARM